LHAGASVAEAQRAPISSSMLASGTNPEPSHADRLSCSRREGRAPTDPRLHAGNELFLGRKGDCAQPPSATAIDAREPAQ
jgi:hypothetical protein